MFKRTVAMDKLSDMFEKYVPMRGKADTVGGEIVRAASRIGYRWYNDGDQLGVGYGNETCNAAGRYLMEKCDDSVVDAVSRAWGVYSEEAYDEKLYSLIDVVVSYLEDNPQTFEQENDEDMWDYREWEDTHYEDEEDDEW